MKIAVFGSRTLKDNRVRFIIQETFEDQKGTILITTQEPAGVCEITQRVAKENAIPLELHFLNFRYNRGAFDHRSREVIKSADFILLIHDGKSKGTANELAQVLKSKKPYRYEVLEPDPLAKNVGFNIKSEWEPVNPDEEKTGWDQFNNEEK